MNKKIAVSFSGLPRIIPTAVNSWQNFISKYQADCFIHLWNDNSYAAYELCRIFKPLFSEISKPNEFDISPYSERLIHSDPFSVFSMWTSINKSFNLIPRDRYSKIIRARFDVSFEEFPLLDNSGIIIPGKAPEVYTFNDKKYSGWHDMIAYGDYESMQIYSDTLYKISEIYNEGSPFFSEFFLSTHLFRSKINVTHQNVFADIIR